MQKVARAKDKYTMSIPMSSSSSPVQNVGLTGARNKKRTRMRLAVNITTKYIVAPCKILSRMLGIPGYLFVIFLALAKMMTKARKSMVERREEGGLYGVY